jgi:hypothetical protein
MTDFGRLRSDLRAFSLAIEQPLAELQATRSRLSTRLGRRPE